MNEKRVVVVIVEGPSEEAAFSSIFKEFFESEKIKFVTVHGDITNKYYIGPDNILSEINSLVKNMMQRYGYSKKDILKIIHIVDTDGTFCKNAIIKSDVKGVHYFTDHIEANNPEKIEQAHMKKSEVLKKLYKTNTIDRIKYKIYFNSCNLEHVLFNELKDFTDEEKEYLSDKFSEDYEGRVEDFISFISSDEIATPGNYRETWDFIRKDKNSLNRFSNMHLIFE